MNINKASLKTFRDDFDAAVKELEAKHNVSIGLGNISFRADQFTTKLTVLNRTESGSVVNPEEKAFKLNAFTYGVSELALGETFMSQGQEYKLTGLKSSRRKFPFSAERVRDGQSFKFDAYTIKNHFPA